jgi:hypothetical protein
MWWVKPAAIALVGLSCVYRLRVPDGQLPRMAVPVFTNQTSEPQLEAVFTQATREMLAQAGRLGTDAEASVLRGEVSQVSLAPLVRSPDRRLPNYRVTATVTLRLMRGAELLSQAQGSAAEDFPAGADILWLETNRGAALRRVAELAVRDALDKLSP